MTEILLFEGTVKYDTELNYSQSWTKLKDQGCTVILTGGSWLLVSRKVTIRKFLRSKIFEYIYFYELDFTEKNPIAKLETIKKLYSTEFMKRPEDNKKEELIWSIKQQVQETQSEDCRL